MCSRVRIGWVNDQDFGLDCQARGVVWSSEDAQGPQHQLPTARQVEQYVKRGTGLVPSHRLPSTALSGDSQAQGARGDISAKRLEEQEAVLYLGSDVDTNRGRVHRRGHLREWRPTARPATRIGSRK
eukprot:9358239-Pyramimonas_sp.AAC.1